MDASDRFGIKGKTLPSAIAALVFLSVAAWMSVIFAKAIISGRLTTSFDLYMLPIIVASIALRGIFFLRAAMMFRSDVVIVSSDGFLDRRRIGATEIGWIHIQKISIERRLGKIFLVLDLAPDCPAIDEFGLVRRFFYRRREAFGSQNISVSMSDLLVSPSILARATRARWRAALKKRIPLHSFPAVGAKMEDKSLAPPFRAMKRRPPHFTFCLVALLVSVFAYQCIRATTNGGVTGQFFALTSFSLTLDGGLVGQAVSNGQWWRLFTAPLLHLSASHLIMESLSLLIAGYLLEGLIGWRWYGAVFVVSALTGAITSFFVWRASSFVSVGTSGGIVGLFGAAMVMALHCSNRAVRAKIMGQAVCILAPMVLFFEGRIDIAAHLGGMVGGAALTAALFPFWDKRANLPRGRIVPATIVAAFVLCVGPSFYQAYQFSEVVLALDPALPTSLEQRMTFSEQLIQRYPRDPRVRYARAAVFYNQDRSDDAKRLLEQVLDDQDVLSIAWTMDWPTRILLAHIYDAEGHRDLAKSVVASLCRRAKPTTFVPSINLCP